MSHAIVRVNENGELLTLIMNTNVLPKTINFSDIKIQHFNPNDVQQMLDININNFQFNNFDKEDSLLNNNYECNIFMMKNVN